MIDDVISSKDKELWKHTRTLKALSNIIEEIIDENKNDVNFKKHVEKQKKLFFNSKKAPSISIYNYLERLLKYTHLEESTVIIGLIYIDRICELNEITLTELNVHRLLFTSILLSIKFNEDDYYSNSNYAKVAGITLQEVNSSECEFLIFCKFKLFVTKDLFEKYLIYLKNYNGKNKGW